MKTALLHGVKWGLFLICCYLLAVVPAQKGLEDTTRWDVHRKNTRIWPPTAAWIISANYARSHGSNIFIRTKNNPM